MVNNSLMAGKDGEKSPANRGGAPIMRMLINLKTAKALGLTAALRCSRVPTR
jgi:hypothetical protein